MEWMLIRSGMSLYSRGNIGHQIIGSQIVPGGTPIYLNSKDDLILNYFNLVK